MAGLRFRAAVVAMGGKTDLVVVAASILCIRTLGIGILVVLLVRHIDCILLSM